MLLVQMSDPHFLPRGMLAYGKLDVAAYLERAVAHVAGLEPAPDAILITGDLTSDGDQAVYAELVGMLGGLVAPVFPLPGNHDRRDLLRAAFPGIVPASGPIAYVIERFPVRVVMLDSLVEGQSYGKLGLDQLAWLDATLRADPAAPTLVALHHPPFRTGIDHMDYSMLQDADALAEVVSRHPQVERVVAGHVHRVIQRRFAGTLAVTAPGIAHQVALVLGPGRGPWDCEPPGVLLHYWSDAAGLVTHVSPIGAYGPTGRFSDPHRVAAPA
jgi:Icc protein